MNSFTNREQTTIPQEFALRSWVSLEPGLEENEWVLIDNRSGAICTCNDSAGVLLVALPVSYTHLTLPTTPYV